MRVGINGRFLIANKTGVQRVAHNLLKTLISVDRENEYFVFTSADEVGKPEWNFPNVKIVASPIYPGKTARNLFWEQVILPREAKRYQVDILHSPANMAPLFYRGKSVIHIHDLCFVVNPQWYSFLFRTWYNWVIPRLAHKATKIITNSNNSRNDLLQFLQVDVDRVSLVYWAVDEYFLEAPKGPGALVSPVAERYILYVGSLEPRKNIKTLVNAFEKLKFDHPELTTKLVLIGKVSSLFADSGLQIENFKEDIIVKGFVDEDLLRSYYRGAEVVVYPSLYEGFGLPPLEAMASGAPVITSATSSLPEVVGDAAIKINPYDVKGLSEAIFHILSDENARQELKEKGYRQARSFNWYRVVRNILSVYYEVHHSENRPDKPLTLLPFERWQALVAMEKAKIGEMNRHLYLG